MKCEIDMFQGSTRRHFENNYMILSPRSQKLKVDKVVFEIDKRGTKLVNDILCGGHKEEARKEGRMRRGGLSSFCARNCTGGRDMNRATLSQSPARKRCDSCINRKYHRSLEKKTFGSLGRMGSLYPSLKFKSLMSPKSIT